MTRDEALETIREEGLHGYVWFEDPSNHTEVVVIQRDGAEWTVLTTNERAGVEGLQRFVDEGEALDDFVRRLRAGRRAEAIHHRRQDRQRAQTE